MKGRLWTPREDTILRRLYPDSKSLHIALFLDRPVRNVYNRAQRLNLKKTGEWLASDEACYLRRHPEAGAPGRFKKGHAAHNKGLRRPGYAPGRMAETQFKKGNISGSAAQRWKPLWSERLSKEGYLEIKFRERENQHGNWRAAHLLLWEDKHGPLPKGHALAFRDGDITHIALRNLELVTRAELMRRNSVHNLPKDLQLVIQLSGALKRKLRSLNETHLNRSL